MKHINQEEKRWAYDRWCEGYTYNQIAEALGVSSGQVDAQLRNLPRIRPILHYCPKSKESDAKEIIKEMAVAVQNSILKCEEGHKALSEDEQSKYGKEILNIVVALYNAGYRRKKR